MERIDEYRFYELGQKIAKINRVESETSYDEIFTELWDAREALRSLKTDVVSLRFSMPVVGRVIAAITAIVPETIRDAIDKAKPDEGGNKPRIGWSYYELGEALREFEPVLASECKALDTYVVSQKRGYVTSDLVDHAERMLPQETVSLLPSTVLADIKGAGRCLALDTPTAAGFHILRALEAVMALYYKHLTGKELPKKNRNWGKFLKNLSEETTADPKVVGALEHIKDNYRNPITHPEETLTEGQAVMLFGLSLSTMEMMAEVMRTLPPALTQLEQLKAQTVIAEAAAEEEDF